MLRQQLTEQEKLQQQKRPATAPTANTSTNKKDYGAFSSNLENDLENSEEVLVEDVDDDDDSDVESWENDEDDSYNDDDEEDDDDDDEETSLLDSDDSSSLTRNLDSSNQIKQRYFCCCPNTTSSSCCRESRQARRKRKRRMRKTYQLFRPILSPLIKVYKVAKDAVILVTNVDNVWDSPALEPPTPVPPGGLGNINANANMNISNRWDGSAAGSSTLSPSSSSLRLVAMGNAAGVGNHTQRHSHQFSSSPHLQHRINRDTTVQRVSFRHKLGVLFWFLVFALAFATERGSFKVLVDRMGPFRMAVGAEGITAVHALVTGVWFGLQWMFCAGASGRNSESIAGAGSSSIENKLVMLPLADIGLMAVLDTVQLLLAVISGAHVAPILTAVLVHFTIPLTTIFTQFIHPDGIFKRAHRSNSNDDGARENQQNNPQQSQEDPQNRTNNTISADNNSDPNTYGGMSSQHLFGSTLILLSTILALSPAVLTLVYPDYFPPKNVMANRTAWNTLLFVLSCIPGAASQMYKEHVMASFAQPVNSNLLNFLISIFSSIFAIIVSPLFYSLQGLADTPVALESGDLKVKWWINLYPSTQVSKNFMNSWQCFTATVSDDIQIRGYPEEAHCDFAYGIVLLHVFSIIVIDHAVQRICNAGAFKIMHRGISAGIILSVISMMYYQIFIDDNDYGFFPNSWHITCAAVLVMGSEVFHRVSFEVPSFETTYPELAALYDSD